MLWIRWCWSASACLVHTVMLCLSVRSQGLLEHRPDCKTPSHGLSALSSAAAAGVSVTPLLSRNECFRALSSSSSVSAWPNWLAWLHKRWSHRRAGCGLNQGLPWPAPPRSHTGGGGLGSSGPPGITGSCPQQDPPHSCPSWATGSCLHCTTQIPSASSWLGYNTHPRCSKQPGPVYGSGEAAGLQPDSPQWMDHHGNTHQGTVSPGF